MGISPRLLDSFSKQFFNFGAPVRIVDLLSQDIFQIEVFSVLSWFCTRVADVALSVQPEEEM